MKKKVSVSVIIPCYRSSETIFRAVESVINQSVCPTEIIVVDDFSEDEKTYETLEKITNKYNLVEVIFLQKNVGPGSARNRGWEIAQGDYIAFLDSDDVWHPKKLEIQYNFMRLHPMIDLSGHKSVIYNGTYENIIENIEPSFISYNKLKFLLKNRIATRTAMMKNGLPFKFLEDKRTSEDFLLWSEMYLSGRSIVKINLALACSFKNDFGESGLTGNLPAMQKGELDTYKKLVDKQLLSNSLYLFLKFYSLSKYYRRKIIVRNRYRKLVN